MESHKCSQEGRFARLETTLDLTNKEVMDKINKMDDKIDDLSEKFDMLLEKLESKFVLRQEFKVAIGVLAVLGALASFIAYFEK